MIAVSVILSIGLAASAMCRWYSAALRHWILATAIACAGISPLLMLIAPAWNYRIVSPESAAPASTVAHVATSPIIPVQIGSAPREVMPEFRDRIVASLVSAGKPVWLAGSALSLLLLLVGLGRLHWLAARSERITVGRWREMADAVARQHGVRRRVILLQSDHPALLVTWGVVHPKIILPAPARGWPEDRIRIVLSHELAHISRSDWLTQMIAELLRVAYWFNPLVWMACRRLRLESEQACDDVVLNEGVEGPAYAMHLLELARAVRNHRRRLLSGYPAPAMARPCSLERRVVAMLNNRRNRRPASRTVRTIAAAGFLAVSLLIVGFGATAQSFATFSGSVRDPGNGFVPGATVTLTNTRTEAKYEVKSDEAGHFEVAGLPPGDYRIDAQFAGFRPLQGSVTVAGKDVRQDLAMQIGSLTEVVTIVAAPGIRTDSVRQSQMPDVRGARARQDCRTSGIGGEIRAPMKIKNVNPVYPDNPDGSVQGIVILEGRVGIDGTISDVKVQRSPHLELTRAATDAFEQWTFTPTLLNCVPIEVSITATMNFAVER